MKTKRSPKAKLSVCWACFRPGHLREDCPDIRARFGFSGNANTDDVEKKEALPCAEKESEDISIHRFLVYLMQCVKVPSA